MKFRPRFSVRTLAIVVMLVCAYFSAWEATKRYGVRKMWYGVATSPLPCIIRYDLGSRDAPDDIYYSVWLFGPEVKVLDVK